MRLYHYDAYCSPCMNCPVGAARQTMRFTPEPGWGPFCVRCGGDLPRTKYGGKGDTQSGICRECNNRGRTNKGNRTNHGKAHWGYKAVATKIIQYNEDKREGI